MTTFETITISIALIAMVSGLYGIKSAAAAGRSAVAAEGQAKTAVEQAKHAEAQANSAKDQARAAERQVDIMLLAFHKEQIGAAIAARRTVYECKSAVGNYYLAVQSPVSRHFGHARDNLMAAAHALEDIPPVFPNAVRGLVLTFLHDIRSKVMTVATLYDEAADAVHRQINQQADAIIAAMDTAIANDIAKLEE